MNNEETLEEKRILVREQTQQAATTGLVTVRSGQTIPLWLAYRCLYCGEWFAQTDAEKHFGMTREQYFLKKQVNEKEPRLES